MKERYSGAGTLVENSYRHCSLTGPSVCTAKHVREYKEKGTLAGSVEGTVCEPDEVPFVGPVGETRRGRRTTRRC